MPRREGMERKDLLAANVKIFKSQGRALAAHAKPTCKVNMILKAVFNLSFRFWLLETRLTQTLTLLPSTPRARFRLATSLP